MAKKKKPFSEKALQTALAIGTRSAVLKLFDTMETKAETAKHKLTEAQPKKRAEAKAKPTKK